MIILFLLVLSFVQLVNGNKKEHRRPSKCSFGFPSVEMIWISLEHRLYLDITQEWAWSKQGEGFVVLD